MEISNAFILGEEGEVVFACNGNGLGGPIIVQVMRLTAKDAAEFLQVREVKALHGTRDELLGGVMREPVAGKERVWLLNAFEAGDARNVEGDHGRWSLEFSACVDVIAAWNVDIRSEVAEDQWEGVP